MRGAADIAKFGRKVVERGLSASFFGNISVRTGDTLTITRTGTMLDELDESALIDVSLTTAGADDRLASSELIVHREIYQRTQADTILHTHSLNTVVAADYFATHAKVSSVGELLPYLVNVPIVEGESGSRELGEAAGEALKENPVIIVRHHGVFAVGPTLKDAYIFIAGLDHYAHEFLLKLMLPAPQAGKLL